MKERTPTGRSVFGVERAMAICIRLHQEQIARAVELGLGAQEPEEIEILTDDEEGEVFAEQMLKILAA